MIVPMKKVTIFVAADRRGEALADLRTLGLLHVRLEAVTGELSAQIEQRLERAKSALARIGHVDEPETLLRRPCAVVDDILELSERRERLLVAKEEAESKLERYRRWSNVSLQAIRDLAEAGVSVRLYNATRATAAEPCRRNDVYRVGQIGRTVLLALITDNPEEKLDLTEEALPPERRRDLLDQRYRIDEELNDVEARLRFLGNYRGMLEEYCELLTTDLEFARVQDSLDEAHGVAHLQGYAPVDRLDALRNAAENNGWAYVFEEPEDLEEVPTLVRNPKWVTVIEPVFSFLGTVPGYNELDISLWFLLFFAIFVAILIGDAGYGLVYLGGALLARRAFPRAPAAPFRLIYILSACTIAWGVLSGTYFGSETLANLPVLRALVVPPIASFDLTRGGLNDNQFFLIRMCFLIGAVHLTLAHVLAGLKKAPAPAALADAGWVAIIWGLYCLTGTLVLGQPFPAVGLYLLIAGSVMALLFTNFQANILRGVAETLIEFPLAVIGGFSDIVSYLRLFAVGYTSLVLASTFNMMAVGDGIGNPVAAVGAALVLFFGHSLNMILAIMGVVVHGVRLKMLEFSGHVGNEWSGYEYEPFRENAIEERGA
jgi:V/A-type H+-transporting ATPase subunit I